MSNKRFFASKAFTIVELLIVIVIIGILAAVVVVAYRGITERASASVLKSDLTNASKQMELANAEQGTYPTTFPSNVKASSNAVLSLSTATKYCINAELSNNSSLRWSYDPSNGGLQEGVCSGAVIAGSELGTKPNLVTNTDFSSGWGLIIQDGTGRSLSVRAGSNGDPYPSRPVLVLNNASTNPTSYSLVRNTAINHSAIVTGKTYTRSFYVRKTGTSFSGSVQLFGILDGNGTNTTVGLGSYSPPTSAWQKISGSAAASQNAPTSNLLYLPVSTSEFTKTGWTLEFQGFELREQN